MIGSSALLLSTLITLSQASPAPFRPATRPNPIAVEERATVPLVSTPGVVIPLTKLAGHLTDSSTVVNLDWLISTRARAQRKYGAANSTLPVEKRAVGSEGLTDSSETLWYGPITIGGQSFNIDFDTGSSDLFVPAASCTTGGCAGHNRYTKSSTGRQQSGSFSISYGDGSSSSGGVWTDNVSVAGLTASNQYFSAATTMASSFAGPGFPADGILGMGFKALSNLGGNPFFQTLISQGKVSSPVFTFYLSESGSQLNLGGIDSSKYTGGITYSPVTKQAYWTIALNGIRVGSTSVSTATNRAIIDSGTTLAYFPTAAAAAIYAAIPGSSSMSAQYGSQYDGYYLFPCSNTKGVSLNFGGSYFTIPASSLSLGSVSYGSNQCVGSVLGSDDFGSSTALVGDVFMSNVYSIFDVGQARVGFANKA